MARVTAPLLGFGASGSIAKTQVYATWKGIPYARRHVVPSNPKSTEQMKTRDVFSFLNSVWKISDANFQAAWTLAAKGQALTDRNLFLKKNIAILRSQLDLTGIVLSPGAKGGLTGTITITPGNDLVTVAGVPPDPMPSGWTVNRLIAAAIKAQDAHDGQDFEVFTATDDTDPYSVNITGLANAAHYLVAGWFEYQKSSLATDLAYGPAIGVDTLTT